MKSVSQTYFKEQEFYNSKKYCQNSKESSDKLNLLTV